MNALIDRAARPWVTAVAVAVPVCVLAAVAASMWLPANSSAADASAPSALDVSLTVTVASGPRVRVNGKLLNHSHLRKVTLVLESEATAGRWKSRVRKVVKLRAPRGRRAGVSRFRFFWQPPRNLNTATMRVRFVDGRRTLATSTPKLLTLRKPAVGARASVREPVIVPVPAPAVVGPPAVPFSAAAVATAANHSCALAMSGEVRCWGSNAVGQLGEGTNAERPGTTSVPGLGAVTRIAAGGRHTCAATGSSVRCWGRSVNGQLGDGVVRPFSATPVAVVALPAAVMQLTAGAEHSCALLSDGTISCWGANQFFQLGSAAPGIRSATPVTVPGVTDAIAVTAGQNHTCAILTGGAVKCWGSNQHGQIGGGVIGNGTAPTTVPGLVAQAISAGGEHTCAVTQDTAVKCWGLNTAGQLGDGTTDQSVPPVTAIASGATQVIAARFHSCALLATGAVRCWGNNDKGSLGDGTTTNRLSPAPVTGLPNAQTALSGSDATVCSLGTDARVRCWGANSQGEVIHTDLIDSPAPRDGPPLGSVTALTASASSSCALTAGSVKCWGMNSAGQLGDGTTRNSSSAVQVSGLTSGVGALSAGGMHACVLHGSAAKCWGLNTSGELGDDSLMDQRAPVQVAGLTSGVQQIAPGRAHTCGLMTDGTARCWGDNSSGQLGNGTNSDYAAPTSVSQAGGLRFSRIAAGSDHTCAVSTVAAVWCWGANASGQLGNGSTTSSTVPVQVSGLAGVSEIAVGGSHSCAIASGVLSCWGSNARGQLGTGGGPQSLIPAAVSSLGSNVVAAAAGLMHTCATGVAGALYCWGAGTGGRLGTGNTADAPTPAPVSGVSVGASLIAAGNSHTCALVFGAIKCWGTGMSGELGDGRPLIVTSPVVVAGI
jgi:alpha-tubulin suppressor-like RCC1 family protein